MADFGEQKKASDVHYGGVGILPSAKIIQILAWRDKLLALTNGGEIFEYEEREWTRTVNGPKSTPAHWRLFHPQIETSL